MRQLIVEARNTARASRATGGASSASRWLAKAVCTSLLHGRRKVLVQWFWNAAVYSPSRNRAISLVPPITRQSMKTERPVFFRYQDWKASPNSCRIASLCGVMMTSDSSNDCPPPLSGRNRNGRATVVTNATMIRIRFSMIAG